MARIYNPSTWKAEAGELLILKSSLVYIGSSSPAKAIQWNLASKTHLPPPPKRKRSKVQGAAILQVKAHSEHNEQKAKIS